MTVAFSQQVKVTMTCDFAVGKLKFRVTQLPNNILNLLDCVEAEAVCEYNWICYVFWEINILPELSLPP